MGNSQQKHQSKGKRKGTKQDGRRSLQEAFQTGDDTFERIEKEEVDGVDPLGNEAAALDDLVEKLDSFSVPRQPVPPPVLNRNLVEEESSLPLSFSSGFQPGECSKNVKEAPEESSNDAPSIQEKVMEIRESTGDKDDEEPFKYMDKAESSGAAESKVVQDAAESEAELDLLVTGVKLVDGLVEIEVELPETAPPSDGPVTDSLTDKGAENLPVKATEPQDWSGMDTSDVAAGSNFVGDAEFEVELPVSGVKAVGDKIEVEVGLPETAVPPEAAPLQTVTNPVPFVPDKGAEKLPVKAAESQDWSERPLDTTKDQETGSEAVRRSEEISVAKSSDDNKDRTRLEQPAREVTVPERIPEAGEEVEMIVQQADKKDSEEFTEPEAEGVLIETTGTAENAHEEAAMTNPSDAAQEPTDAKGSTSVQHTTLEAAVKEAGQPVAEAVRTETAGTPEDIHEEVLGSPSPSDAAQEPVQHATLETAVHEAGEHVEKQPHETEETGQEDSGDFIISHDASPESQDEPRAAGDDKAVQAEDENVSTEKTEDSEAWVKDENLDMSSPVEVSNQFGILVDGSPSAAAGPEEAEEADVNGQAGIVLEPEQLRDLIPEADDGSVPADQEQIGDPAVVEDLKAEKAALDANEPEPESLKLQADSEESSANEGNQEKTTQTDGLKASKDEEEVAASENKALKDAEGASGPVTQSSEELKLPEPEMELVPQAQRSAEFKDALELGPDTQVSEDFKDAVSELDLSLEMQGQEEVKNESEAAQGSGEEPELERTPEVQGLKHAEPESESLEDLLDAEPVFETPRGVEASETELEPPLEVQGLKHAEPESESFGDLLDAEPVFETPRAVEDSEIELEPAAEVQGLEEMESADLGDAEPIFGVAPEVLEPADVVESLQEGENVLEAAPEFQGSEGTSHSGQPAKIEEPPATELVSSGAREHAQPAPEASDANAAETRPVLSWSSRGVEGTEPSEVDGTVVSEELTPVEESVTREAHEDRSFDYESRQVPVGPNDQQTEQAEDAKPAPAELLEQVDESREESVTEQADVQGSNQAEIAGPEPTGTEALVTESDADFEELNPGISQAELETEERPVAEAAPIQFERQEAEYAKPEVKLEEDEPVSETSRGNTGKDVWELEEQSGTFEVEPSQALEVEPEVSQQDPTIEKAVEGSMGGQSEAEASQAVVSKPVSSESHTSQPETAKESNDEAEAAETGTLVLEPGDVEPVLSELKSEPELPGETDHEHGHGRSVDSLEAQVPPAGEQDAEPVSISVSGYQEQEINKESSAATAEVAAEGDSSQAAWSEEPKADGEEEPISSIAEDHAALTGTYTEPDPDDVEEAEVEPEEPVAAVEDESGLKDVQVGGEDSEEQSSSTRVKIVPGQDVDEDLHSNSEVPASGVIQEEKEAPSSSSIAAIANEEVISKMRNEPVKADKGAQKKTVEVPGNVAGVEVL